MCFSTLLTAGWLTLRSCAAPVTDPACITA